MEIEHSFLKDARSIDITKRQWVVAIGHVLTKKLGDGNIEPTPQELMNFLREPDPFLRELNMEAHALVTEEYDALYTLALKNGFDIKTAVSLTRRIIKEKYRALEEVDTENFFYLDPLIFAGFN